MEKVFVLICDWYWDCSGSGKEIKVFSSLDKAKAEMVAEFEKYIVDEGGRNTILENMVIDEEDTSRQIYEYGWYDTAHIAWEIVEKNVDDNE